MTQCLILRNNAVRVTHLEDDQLIAFGDCPRCAVNPFRIVVADKVTCASYKEHVGKMRK